MLEHRHHHGTLAAGCLSLLNLDSQIKESVEPWKYSTNQVWWFMTVIPGTGEAGSRKTKSSRSII